MHRRQTRAAPSAVALGAGALLLAAGLPAAAAAAGEHVLAQGTFSTTGPAWTYDPVVPAGATATVRATTTGSGRTVATLHVRGLAPEARFAVHAHTGTCSGDPATSQGHYQHVPGGPVDDVNELWLDFATNPAGDGRAQAVVQWQFREGGARSITLHDPSRTGKRVACLPVAF